MSRLLQQIRDRLLSLASRLHRLARQGHLSEVWLIRFDKELIDSIDYLDYLIEKGVGA